MYGSAIEFFLHLSDLNWVGAIHQDLGQAKRRLEKRRRIENRGDQRYR
jgi:hypothetical protein